VLPGTQRAWPGTTQRAAQIVTFPRWTEQAEIMGPRAKSACGLTKLPLLACLLGAQPAAGWAAELGLARGQVLYVPAYSEIAYGDRRHTLNLSATVTIRNTDRKHPIKLTRVDYFNTSGSLIRSYQSQPRVLAPMASGDYVITGADRTGGTASSFLVEWESADAVSPPLVEAVMIGAAATNGISFTSTAQVLEERR
jgi:hypothetical protein